ncbi:MAG: ABC transporter permease [Actinomycetota bacterium]|nr:ABC transporter permease [Actinomycetota bacterium]
MSNDLNDRTGDGITIVAEPDDGIVIVEEADSVGEYVARWWRSIRSGNLGSLPILVGLVIIGIVFGILEDTFLTSRNFTNLILQASATATIAIGAVFVLLIAQIDLSVAYVSAVGSVVTVLLLRPGDPGWPWWAAIAAGVALSTAIGLLHGMIITKAGVPSFVVTLAGLLSWQGVVLILTTQFSTAGTIVIQDSVVVGIANDFLADWLGWLLAIVIVGGFAAQELFKARARRSRGLDMKPTAVIAAQVVGLGAVAFAAVAFVNVDRGVPVAAVLLIFFLLFWSFVATRTRFGRHVYAVGGNPEAARRAGIDVDRIRVYVFMIAGFMAGVGGIVLASRLRSVATNTGGGELLLEVIAAAVIGGTSLFGGNGKVVSALLGALVIASVKNGMDLMGLNAGTKFVITGLVLLLAVLVDALSKRGRAARGLA